MTAHMSLLTKNEDYSVQLVSFEKTLIPLQHLFYTVLLSRSDSSELGIYPKSQGANQRLNQRKPLAFMVHEGKSS